MKRFLLRIAYDGTNYNGWQIQKNGSTIQGKIEDKLSEIAKQKIAITGSGRTDAGVHALDQYAHFDFPVSMEPEQIRLALTSKLPSDILVYQVFSVNKDFHARFDAKSRTYYYFISKTSTPFNYRYMTYFSRKNIEIKTINKAIELFSGTHDFSYFAKKNPDLDHYVCRIKEISFEERNGFYQFRIRANRFLHNMVRRIIGTLVTISDKNSHTSVITKMLKKEKVAPNYIYTAPPNGLFLARVEYPDYEFGKTTRIPLFGQLFKDQLS